MSRLFGTRSASNAIQRAAASAGKEQTPTVGPPLDDPPLDDEPHDEPPVEPSPQSSVDSPNFKLMQSTLAEVFPNAVVAPFVFVAATDSKHYAPLTQDIYRFAPMLMTSEDVGRIHGTNERISVPIFAKMIDFYAQLIRNATS